MERKKDGRACGAYHVTERVLPDLEQRDVGLIACAERREEEALVLGAQRDGVGDESRRLLLLNGRDLATLQLQL